MFLNVVKNIILIPNEDTIKKAVDQCHTGEMVI